MVDPVVRSRTAGDDENGASRPVVTEGAFPAAGDAPPTPGDDGHRELPGGGSDDDVAEVVDSGAGIDDETDSEPHSEPHSEPGSESDSEPDSESLFDDTSEPADNGQPYGELGRPVSRHSAFYKGFVGTAGVLVAILLGLAVRQAASVLELLLIAVFLAVGLNPIVEFSIRRGIKRGWAVLGVALLVIAFLTLVVVVVGGVLRNQITTFIDDAPKLINDLRQHKSIAHLDAKYHILTSIQHRLQDPNFLTKTFGGAFSVGLTVLNGVFATIVVFVLTLYFLAALPNLKRSLYSLAPSTRRDRVGQLGDEILRRVGRYVIGAFSVAMIAGTVSLLFMLSVGMTQYALPLALMVALLDLVPLVGSILGAAIVSIVGLANSLSVGIACIVFYVIYETLEGYVIYPRVMRSSVDVPEYATIIAVLVGGAVAGIVGALLALPIAAALLLIIQEVWVRRQDQT